VSHVITSYVIGSSGHPSSVGSIREWSISAADVAGQVVVVAACIAHQSKSARRSRVACEVGTVVKARITAAAQAELVQVVLLRTLFFSEFEARNVLGLSFVGPNLNNNITGRFKELSRSSSSSSIEASSSGNSNSIPVVGSRVIRSHFSSVVVFVQGTTVQLNAEKVFQFYANVSMFIMIIKNPRNKK
jgi:hypothetical protein